jgi:hypothetical protein
MASGKAYDGATWREATTMSAYDGATWRVCQSCKAYDGATWREFFTSCATGSLNSVTVNIMQDGACEGEPPSCTSELEIRVSWDYATCDDSCHHIEVWSKRSASSACTTVSYTKEVDDLSCDNDPADCTPAGSNDGCWYDDGIGDYRDLASSTVYFCYEVRIVRDSDEGTDDSDSSYDSEKTSDCVFECEFGEP